MCQFRYCTEFSKAASSPSRNPITRGIRPDAEITRLLCCFAAIDPKKVRGGRSRGKRRLTIDHLLHARLRSGKRGRPETLAGTTSRCHPFLAERLEAPPATQSYSCLFGSSTHTYGWLHRRLSVTRRTGRPKRLISGPISSSLLEAAPVADRPKTAAKSARADQFSL
jgi:hypothetical protein